MITGIVTMDGGIMELDSTIDSNTLIGDIGSADVKIIEYGDPSKSTIKVTAVGKDAKGARAMYHFKFNINNIKLVLEKEIIQEGIHSQNGVKVTGDINKD